MHREAINDARKLTPSVATSAFSTSTRSGIKSRRAQMPYDTTLASQGISSRRRHKKPNQAKGSLGLSQDTTPTTRRRASGHWTSQDSNCQHIFFSLCNSWRYLTLMRLGEENTFAKHRDKQQLRISCVFPRTAERDQLIRSANGLTTTDHDQTFPVPEPWSLCQILWLVVSKSSCYAQAHYLLLGNAPRGFRWVRTSCTLENSYRELPAL